MSAALAEMALVVRVHLPPVPPDDPRVAALATRVLACPLAGVAVAVTPTALEALAARAPEAVAHLLSASERLTAPATDTFFPLLDHDRAAMSAQLELAVRTHTRCLGEAPGGIWFPDGGYEPRTDDLLAANGLRYAVVDAGAVSSASAAPAYGVYAPLSCPGTGVAVFARDPEARRLAPADVPARPLAPDAETARACDEALAAAFVSARVVQAAALEKRMDRPPLMVVGLDVSELSPTLLAASRATGAIALTTPGAHLAKAPALQRAWPGPSRAGGLVAAMCAPERAWLLRHLHAANARIPALLQSGADAAVRLGLRELLMAQSGDWMRALAEGDAEGQARITDHLRAFARIADDPPGLDPVWAAERAEKWPCFGDVDAALFEPKAPPPRPVAPTDRAVDRYSMPRPNEIW